MKNKILFNNLSVQEKINITKNHYSKKNNLKLLNGKNSFEFNCIQHSKLLRESLEKNIIKKKLVKNKNFILEKIEKNLKSKYKKYDTTNTNKISEEFYTLDKDFQKKYLNFLKFLKKELFNFSFYYQIVPNIRVGIHSKNKFPTLPDLHTDYFLGHPFEVINIWLPLTRPDKNEFHNFKVCSLKASKIAMKNFNYNIDNAKKKISHEKNIELNNFLLKNSKDIKTDFGKVLIFDSRCVHTALRCKDHSRISIDIRIYPKQSYIKSKYIFRGTGRRKKLYQHKSSYGLL